MEAYFDNSATTRCFDEVKDIVCKTMTEDFGNPSAHAIKREWKRRIMSAEVPRPLQNY